MFVADVCRKDFSNSIIEYMTFRLPLEPAEIQFGLTCCEGTGIWSRSFYNFMEMRKLADFVEVA